MGMYDQPGSGVSPWRVIRVVVVVAIGALRLVTRGDCSSSSSSRYRYTPPDYSDYGGVDYNALGALDRLAAMDRGRMTMPGMSVIAPGGETADITGDRANGQASSSSHDTWSILWQEGVIEDHDALVKAIGKFATVEAAKEGERALTPSPLRELTVGGIPASQVTLEGSTPQDAIVVTIVPCTGRTVFINVVQPSGDVLAESDAITSTFECDAPPPPSGPVFAQRKGWEPDDSDPPGYSNAHDVYVNSWGLAGALDDDPFGIIAASEAFADFTPTTEKPSKQRNRYTWTGMFEVDGTKRPGAVTAWQCSDLRIAVTTVSAPARKYVVEGQALAATAKCE